MNIIDWLKSFQVSGILKLLVFEFAVLIVSQSSRAQSTASGSIASIKDTTTGNSKSLFYVAGSVISIPNILDKDRAVIQDINSEYSCYTKAGQLLVNCNRIEVLNSVDKPIMHLHFSFMPNAKLPQLKNKEYSKLDAMGKSSRNILLPMYKLKDRNGYSSNRYIGFGNSLDTLIDKKGIMLQENKQLTDSFGKSNIHIQSDSYDTTLNAITNNQSDEVFKRKLDIQMKGFALFEATLNESECFLRGVNFKGLSSTFSVGSVFFKTAFGETLPYDNYGLVMENIGSVKDGLPKQKFYYLRTGFGDLGKTNIHLIYLSVIPHTRLESLIPHSSNYLNIHEADYKYKNIGFMSTIYLDRVNKLEIATLSTIPVPVGSKSDLWHVNPTSYDMISAKCELFPFKELSVFTGFEIEGPMFNSINYFGQ